MVKYSYRNKSFTLIELIIYILIISILGLLTGIIFYGITFYSNTYLSKLNLRNEMFSIMNRLYFNSIFATSVEITSNSIKFNLYPGDYEKLYLSGNKIYLENEATSTLFTSEKVNVNNFDVSTSSEFYNVFIKLSDLNDNQFLYLTTTLYLWNF
ncbi:MAG: hypothetical protein KatS3mg095_0011 [Candidatus Parcubacteria bacterium]|nr:MAG: hypothetical protein KatS3mg095_0011 [Candidatus Parcubacteria bacterium]